jgi:hypothetical protein
MGDRRRRWFSTLKRSGNGESSVAADKTSGVARLDGHARVTSGSEGGDLPATDGLTSSPSLWQQDSGETRPSSEDAKGAREPDCCGHLEARMCKWSSGGKPALGTL